MALTDIQTKKLQETYTAWLATDAGKAAAKKSDGKTDAGKEALTTEFLAYVTAMPDKTGLEFVAAQADETKAALAPMITKGATEEKSMFGGIMDFLKNNMFTGGALALGAIAGNALGLGTIGTVLLAVAGGAAGAYFGDKENGFLGKNLFGLEAHKKKEGTGGPFIAPKGANVAITTLVDVAPLKPMAKGKSFGEVALSEYKPEAGIASLNEDAATKDSNITHSVTLKHEGREMTYYGTLAGDKLEVKFARVSKEGVPTETTPVRDERKTPITLTVKDGKATLDEATSNTLITKGNEIIGSELPGKTIGVDPTIGKIPEKLKTEISEPKFEAGKDTAMVTIKITNAEPKAGERNFERTFQAEYNQKTKELVVKERNTRTDGNKTADAAGFSAITIKDVEMDGANLKLDKVAAQAKTIVSKGEENAPATGTWLAGNMPGSNPQFDKLIDEAKKLETGSAPRTARAQADGASLA